MSADPQWLVTLVQLFYTMTAVVDVVCVIVFQKGAPNDNRARIAGMRRAMFPCIKWKVEPMVSSMTAKAGAVSPTVG